ncbi:MAG: tyrosine-type recombinase/integrase [Janthinobacterium lividum]
MNGRTLATEASAANAASAARIEDQAQVPVQVATDPQLVESWLAQLHSQRQLSLLTIASYRRDMAELGKLMAAQPQPTSFAGLTHQQVRGFAARLHGRGLNARTIARMLSAWRGFYNWLALDGCAPLHPHQPQRHAESRLQTLTANPVDGVKAPKRTRPLPKALSVDDAVRTVQQPVQMQAQYGTGRAATAKPGNTAHPAEPDNLAVPQSTAAPSAAMVNHGSQDGNGAADAGAASADAAAVCDLAMFELLYSSGLRVSELVALDRRHLAAHAATGSPASTSWLDLDSAEVVVTGKGGKQRRVPVGEKALAALATWLAARQSLAISAAPDDQRALFLNQRGRRMSVRVVQLRLKAHAEAVGIPANVHPHMLRHSFASHVLQSSGDLRAVQEMLGHASITSTQVYTSLDFMHLAKVYDGAHPRAKKKSPGSD